MQHIEIKRSLAGPKGLPIVGSLVSLVREPVPFLLDASRTFGDLVPIRLGLETALLLNRPEQIEHVLQRHHRKYRKTRLIAKLEPVLGKGLLTSDGDQWASQRRLMQPAFHRRKIEALFGTMRDIVTGRISNWQQAARSGKEFDVAREMATTALEVAVRTMFGADIGDRIDSAIESIEYLQVETPKRIFSLTPLREWIPSSARSRFIEARRELDEIIYGIIDARRASSHDRDDLLSLLMDSRDEETGSRMTDRQLRDEMMTLFAAGHETTANAMTWAFSLLAEHQDVREGVVAELEACFGNADPVIEGLSKLDWTTAVINETLRLYPPIWWTSRVNVEDDEIANHRVPRNTNVLICPWTIQRHPAVWQRPDCFEPQRFLPENSRGRHKFAFFPFGAGPRVCIGGGFAMMEMKLILASVLRRFELEQIGEAEIEPGPYLTLKIRDGFRIRVRERTMGADAVLGSAA